MRISVSNSELSPALTRYAEVRTWLALQKLSVRVAWVSVCLRNLSGPRAGDGKSCRLEAWAKDVGLVVVEHSDADPAIAVEVALSKLKRAINQRSRKRWQSARRAGSAAREWRWPTGAATRRSASSTAAEKTSPSYAHRAAW